jgi:hypothetical protein
MDDRICGQVAQTIDQAPRRAGGQPGFHFNRRVKRNSLVAARSFEEEKMLPLFDMLANSQN